MDSVSISLSILSKVVLPLALKLDFVQKALKNIEIIEGEKCLKKIAALQLNHLQAAIHWFAEAYLFLKEEKKCITEKWSQLLQMLQIAENHAVQIYTDSENVPLG